MVALNLGEFDKDFFLRSYLLHLLYDGNGIWIGGIHAVEAFESLEVKIPTYAFAESENREQMFSFQFRSPGVILGFQSLGLTFFGIRTYCGYCLGCKYSSVFSIFIRKYWKSTTVYAVCASSVVMITIKMGLGSCAEITFQLASCFDTFFMMNIHI